MVEAGSVYPETSSAHERKVPKRHLYIFVGPEGSGKSTHANLLAEELNLPLVGMGDQFRELAEEDSDLGRESKRMLDSHEYSSPNLYWAVIERMLKNDRLKNGFVLEGAFREKYQIEDRENGWDFESEIRKHIGDVQTTVIHIRLAGWQSVERLLKRGREGDTEEGIIKRLTNFNRDLGARTTLLRNNRKIKFIQVVANNQSEEELHEEIMKRIGGDSNDNE